MRVIVEDETGQRFSYNTDKNENCLCPGMDERPGVVAALEEATRFLSGPPAPLLADG